MRRREVKRDEVGEAGVGGPGALRVREGGGKRRVILAWILLTATRHGLNFIVASIHNLIYTKSAHVIYLGDFYSRAAGIKCPRRCSAGVPNLCPPDKQSQHNVP